MNQISENTSKNTHTTVAQLLFEDGITGKVLDIPSGYGAFTHRLMQKNIEVYPADIDNILQVENKNFTIADMNKPLPYNDGFFSAVVCIDGIEHLEKPFDFIRECQRVLQPNGTLIISTPNISSLRSRWRWFWSGHHNKCKSPLNEIKPGFLHHINMLSSHKLRYILHTNSFRIVKFTTNRIKLISYLYFVFIPLSYLYTLLVYNKEEKDPLQREENKQIIKQSFSPSLLFGETMIVKAVKKA